MLRKVPNGAKLLMLFTSRAGRRRRISTPATASRRDFGTRRSGSGLLLSHAPCPRTAEKHSCETGLYTTPNCARPCCTYATDTAKCGMPLTKLFVPSIGSSTHKPCWALFHNRCCFSDVISSPSTGAAIISGSLHSNACCAAKSALESMLPSALRALSTFR